MSEDHKPKTIYEIRVEGSLGEMWRSCFEGMTILEEPGQEPGRCVTLIAGPVEDQPALHGLLARIRDLNLTLVSVERVQA